MSATSQPVPFQVYEAGVYLHGTKAELLVGEMLVPGRESNFLEGRVMNYVYFTAPSTPLSGAPSWLRGTAAGGSTSSTRRADSKTTPTSRTGGFPGVRRSPFAAASRCAP
jgi:rifampin ADP-ribosylating transferase